MQRPHWSAAQCNARHQLRHEPQKTDRTTLDNGARPHLVPSTLKRTKASTAALRASSKDLAGSCSFLIARASSLRSTLPSEFVSATANRRPESSGVTDSTAKTALAASIGRGFSCAGAHSGQFTAAGPFFHLQFCRHAEKLLVEVHVLVSCALRSVITSMEHALLKVSLPRNRATEV